MLKSENLKVLLTFFVDYLDVNAVFDPCSWQFHDFGDDFVQQKDSQRAQTQAELKKQHIDYENILNNSLESFESC